jgi:hypothetical protein
MIVGSSKTVKTLPLSTEQDQHKGMAHRSQQGRYHVSSHSCGVTDMVRWDSPSQARQKLSSCSKLCSTHMYCTAI